jgi:hypothetical protein
MYVIVIGTDEDGCAVYQIDAASQDQATEIAETYEHQHRIQNQLDGYINDASAALTPIVG